jgi:hypothetical protein
MQVFRIIFLGVDANFLELFYLIKITNNNKKKDRKRFPFPLFLFLSFPPFFAHPRRSRGVILFVLLAFFPRSRLLRDRRLFINSAHYRVYLKIKRRIGKGSLSLFFFFFLTLLSLLTPGEAGGDSFCSSSFLS